MEVALVRVNALNTLSKGEFPHPHPHSGKTRSLVRSASAPALLIGGFDSATHNATPAADTSGSSPPTLTLICYVRLDFTHELALDSVVSREHFFHATQI